MGAVMLGLVIFALGIFLLPFAFPTPPGIITRFQGTSLFSPNGDGRRDDARISVRARVPQTLTLEIRDGDRVIAVLADKKAVRRRGWQRFTWDGRGADGAALPDGSYGIHVYGRQGKKVFDKSRRITIDTSPPATPEVSLGSAGVTDVPRGAQCALEVTSADDARLRAQVRRANGRPPDAVRTLGPRPERSGEPVRWNWTGTDAAGGALAPGLYAFRIESRDAARNGAIVRRSCWVGNLVGTAEPADPQPGDRVGVRLRRPDGTPLAAETPTALRLYRRVGAPGLDSEILGSPRSRAATGRAGRVTIRLPRGIRPSALWLVAEADGGRALIPLGQG